MTTSKLVLQQTRLRVALVAYCVAMAPVLAQIGSPILPNPGNPSMNRAQQEKLGVEVAQEVYKQMPVLPDSSPLVQYVQRVGQRLARTIPPEHSWPFQFQVIEQAEINAFALPGGPMFINVGTIRAARNEGELVGVMAHEMAHVYMQHSAKQQRKSSILSGFAGIAGVIAGSVGGNWGALARSGIHFGAGMLMMNYSRQDEAQADSVGAIIMWKANYNPIGLADFFEILERQGGSGGPQFLNSHPNPGNRRQAIQREIAEWPVQRFRTNETEFLAVQERAQSVPAYSAQEIAAGAKNGRWSAQNRRNGAVFSGPAGKPD